MKTVVVKKNDANQRLDKFLIKSFPNLPQSLIYKYIRKKRIKLNNKRIEASYKLSAGDVLYLYINDEFLETKLDKDFLSAQDQLDIVYEDDNIILVNKPVGLLVHEDESQKIDTLINRIKRYLYYKKEFDPQKEQSFVPALVNRIDRNTQGIVVAAKNAETLRILNQKFKDREIKKFYLCLVHGSFVKKNFSKNDCFLDKSSSKAKVKSMKAKQGDILKGYLVKNDKENRVYIYNKFVPNSKTILTKYKVLKDNIYNRDISMLEVELLTGRTHQIRAHMAYIGHPLVGDTKYGTAKINRNCGVKYQLLVSYKVVFDFKTEAGILNYLDKKTFMIDINVDDLLNMII